MLIPIHPSQSFLPTPSALRYKYICEAVTKPWKMKKKSCSQGRRCSDRLMHSQLYLSWLVIWSPCDRVSEQQAIPGPLPNHTIIESLPISPTYNEKGNPNHAGDVGGLPSLSYIITADCLPPFPLYSNNEYISQLTCLTVWVGLHRHLHDMKENLKQ